MIFLAAAAAACILLWPVLVLAVKRIRMAIRLRLACRREGHRLVPLHLFWFWGLNNSSRADFLVRTKGGRAVYTGKLFGALHRLSNVYFIRSPKGEISVRWRRVIPLAGRFASMLDDDLMPMAGETSGINYVHDSRRKPRREVDYVTPTEGEHRTVIPVLLVCPAPLSVRESEEIPTAPLLTDTPPMFSKREDVRLESRTVYDGGLLHGAEYVYGTSGFAKELADLRLPRDYGIF